MEDICRTGDEQQHLKYFKETTEEIEEDLFFEENKLAIMAS